MHFPRELEDAAFRGENGEYAWQRQEALAAVCVLAAGGRAVLGGEVWLVRDGEIWAGFSLTSGPSGGYAWATDRLPEEPWPTYVTRACAEAHAAIRAAPHEAEVAVPPNANVYFNLTWAGADN